MLCQNCNKRPASVHYSQVINENKVEMYLCEECANRKGQQMLGLTSDIGDFFSGFLGLGAAAPHGTAPAREIVCDKCGMSFEDFRKTGKLGCGNCYEVFGDKLRPILKRVHGSVEHNGRMPAGVSKTINATKEVERLKALLNKAIQNEEYEKAAELRDSIKLLEAQGKEA